MHQGGLVFVRQPEQGVGDAEAVFCTLAEEEQPVVIDIAYSVSAQNAIPASVHLPYSGVEISKHDKFVIPQG